MDEKEKTDLRIVKTHRQLWESMVELTLEKGFDKVTVNDICRRALINRSTFYRHFEDKFDLLLRKTDEILFDMAREAKGAQEVAAEKDYSEYDLFLKFIGEHSRFFKVMLGPNGIQQFSDRIYNYLFDVTRIRLKQWPLDFDRSPVPLDLLLHYIAGSHFSLIKWWVLNDLPCSREELITYNIQLFSNDPLSLLGMSEEVMQAIRNI